MRKASIQEVLDKNGIMVIDGSMSTALEALGANTKSSLWTAAALAEQPELVKQVHLDYFRAGADCGITCSYQATIPGLTAHGYSVEEAERIIADSVRVFLEARDEWWEEEGREALRESRDHRGDDRQIPVAAFRRRSSAGCHGPGGDQ